MPSNHLILCRALFFEPHSEVGTTPLYLTYDETALCACVLSHFCRVRLFVTPWTVARQAPLSMGFPRQAYWSGLPFPSPEDLAHPGIEPQSLVSPALAGGFFTTKPPGKSHASDLRNLKSPPTSGCVPPRRSLKVKGAFAPKETSSHRNASGSRRSLNRRVKEHRRHRMKP